MTIWFTSDQHYGHRNIITYCNRPFKDVDDMTEQLIANHNSVVKDGDTVYHLGDFSMSEKMVQPVLSRLNGVHILIPGNHDRCHPTHKKCKCVDAERRKYLEYGFTDVLDLIVPDFHGFLLCHMPRVEDGRHGERYSQYRPVVKTGQWQLHGHIHQLWKIRESERMINVGVDAFDYKPVSLETLIELRSVGS